VLAMWGMREQGAATMPDDDSMNDVD